MFNLLFIDAAQITLIVVVAALLILYPVFMYFRNKKEKEKRDQLYEVIKKGDYVITYSGIMGEVVEILEKHNGKFLTLRTGDEPRCGYVCVTIDAVYSFTDNKDKIFGVDGEVVEEKPEEKVEDKAEAKQEPKAEEKVEEVKEEPKSSTKKSSKKSKKTEK